MTASTPLATLRLRHGGATVSVPLYAPDDEPTLVSRIDPPADLAPDTQRSGPPTVRRVLPARAVGRALERAALALGLSHDDVLHDQARYAETSGPHAADPHPTPVCPILLDLSDLDELPTEWLLDDAEGTSP